MKEAPDDSGFRRLRAHEVITPTRFPRDQVPAKIGRTRSHVDKGITAAAKMSVMKFVTCVRWCIIAIIATSFAACATQNGGGDTTRPDNRDHTESKDYGWHRTKWINT